MTYMEQLDLADLLGPPRAATENAAPAGPRNGVETVAHTKIAKGENTTSPESWLDLPLPITLFRSKTDTTPHNETLSLRQFVDRAGRVAADEKFALPLVKLGTFKGGRKAEHLVARHGIEIDYDAGDVSPSEAAARLRAAEVAAVVFTSSSHKADAPRWRVLLPTAAPIKALKSTYGDAPAFQLVAGVSDLLSQESPDLVALLEAVKAQRPALIVIDTLAMAFPGLEENSAEAMGRVVSVARKLTKWGAAVVLVHHDTKDGQQGLPRGHSLLNGALDLGLHIKRDESGVVRGKLTKNRNGPCDKDIGFTIATIEGGTDEDGDEIRLPYAAPCSATAHYRAEILPRSERAALDVLEREGGRLPEADYKDAMANGRDVSASDNAKSRRDSVTRAIRGLLEKGRITFKNGFYSIPDDFDDLDAGFEAAATTRHDATEARQIAIVATRQTDAQARPTRQGGFSPVALSRRIDAPELKQAGRVG